MTSRRRPGSTRRRVPRSVAPAPFLRTVSKSNVSPYQPRIALYSPGMVGLGHIRRNLLITQAIAQSSLRPVILLVAEAREATAFVMPDGVDCISLPAARKDLDGKRTPRYLNISLPDLIRMRQSAIYATLNSFLPDLLIVDHLPLGAFDELETTLKSLRSKHGTRCVLGLRDILSDPAIVECEWGNGHNQDAIVKYFDEVWIYGDPLVYDQLQQYGFRNQVRNKIRFTGYLDQTIRLKGIENLNPLDSLDLPSGKLALCMVGGGQDGARLAEAFAEATLPPGTNGVIVTGPFMSEEVSDQLQTICSTKSHMRVISFCSEPTQLLQHADYVIAMGGYNTICEVLSFEKRALIVPRVRRAPEQLIRADRLRELGLISLLQPEDLTPSALASWMATESPEPKEIRETIDFKGLERISQFVTELLAPENAKKQKEA